MAESHQQGQEIEKYKNIIGFGLLLRFVDICEWMSPVLSIKKYKQ